jgi:hypothetical protein
MRQKSLRLSLAEEPRVNVADEEDVVADTQETMMRSVIVALDHTTTVVNPLTMASARIAIQIVSE